MKGITMAAFTRALAIVALMLGAGQASAHAFLKTASPAVGSTLQQAPAQLVIDFTEGVEPSFCTIAVQDDSGADYVEGAPHLVGGDTHLAVALKPLQAGTYKVTWHATAVDTHKTQGRYSFTIGK
jgi:methionine-rich copper-binding protein CopC